MDKRAVRLFAVVVISLTCDLAFGSSPSEQPIQIDGPDGPIRGVLTQLNDHGDQPTILIVPGSGPTDLDGNNKYGITAAPYRMLAADLGVHNIAVARFNKRGIGSSAGAMRDPNDVTMQDYSDDVSAWVRLLKTKTRNSCIWLLGHSEGGVIALLAAQKNADVCGLVLIASPGRPLATVIREQLTRNPANAPILDAANEAIHELENGRQFDDATLPAPLMPLFAHKVQRFLISEMAIDPAVLASNAHKPILVVQGTNDLQVTMEDAQKLAASASRATLAKISGMNHVMKVVANHDNAANLAAYGNPDLPLAPNLVDTIVKFINSHPGKSQR
jgi:hypothetical protein